LLIFKVSIKRYEDIANFTRPSHQFSILNSGPTKRLNGRNFMERNKSGKSNRDIFIK